MSEIRRAALPIFSGEKTEWLRVTFHESLLPFLPACAILEPDSNPDLSPPLGIETETELIKTSPSPDPHRANPKEIL